MILSIKPSVLLGRMQMVKTEGDTDFHFAKVLLVKRHWLGRKMDAVVADDDKFPEVKEMKLFVQEEKEYREIDVKEIFCKSLFNGKIWFKFKEEMI